MDTLQDNTLFVPLLFRRALDRMSAGVLVYQVVRDTQGTVVDFRYVYANEQAAACVGLPADTLPGRTLCDVYGQIQPLFGWYCEVEQQGQPLRFDFERPSIRGLPGSWYDVLVQPLDGGIVVSFSDVTDRKQMQQRQDELVRQVRRLSETVDQMTSLQQQVRSLGALLRSASHDLRGSLSIVQSAAGLLTYAQTDAERAQMLGILQDKVQEVTQQITDLLDYTRLEAGQEQTQISALNAGELLLKLSEYIKPLVTGKGLTFCAEGPASLPIEGDALMLSRVVQHMAIHALNYTLLGDISFCWTEADAYQWCFCLTATGPATSNAGEPISLQIVRHLCELLHGQLRVESSPAGSTLQLTLPRHYHPAQPATQPSHPTGTI